MSRSSAALRQSAEKRQRTALLLTLLTSFVWAGGQSRTRATGTPRALLSVRASSVIVVRRSSLTSVSSLIVVRRSKAVIMSLELGLAARVSAESATAVNGHFAPLRPKTERLPEDRMLAVTEALSSCERPAEVDGPAMADSESELAEGAE